MSRLDDVRQTAGTAAATTNAGNTAVVLEGPKPKGIIKEPYVAFSAPTKDAQYRVIIYANKFCMMPQYSVLYDVFFEGKGEGVSLIFPHHRILMFGRYLLPLVAALRTNSIEWLREFHPTFSTLSDDPEAAVIESIEIITTVKNPMGDPNEETPK